MQTYNNLMVYDHQICDSRVFLFFPGYDHQVWGSRVFLFFPGYDNQVWGSRISNLCL